MWREPVPASVSIHFQRFREGTFLDAHGLRGYGKWGQNPGIPLTFPISDGMDGAQLCNFQLEIRLA